MTQEAYKARYDAYVVLTEQRLKTLCDEYLPVAARISQAARYSLLGGGKRVRAVLVLAACEYLKPSTEKLIRKFVAEGGTVLVSDSLPVLDNDSVPVWLGINSREKEVYQPGIYLTPFRKKSIDAELPLVRGDIHRLKLRSAQTILYGTEQYDGTLMGAGFNSSSDTPGKVPLLTVNRYGKGAAYYLNAPIFSDYIDVSPQQKKWCEELFFFFLKTPTGYLDSPSGNVEMA